MSVARPAHGSKRECISLRAMVWALAIAPSLIVGGAFGEEPPSSPWAPPWQAQAAPPVVSSVAPLFPAPLLAQVSTDGPTGPNDPEELSLPDSVLSDDTLLLDQMPSRRDMDAVLRRLDELEQRLGEVPRQKEQMPDMEKAPDVAWTDLSMEGWTVKLGGHMQLDTINWANASPSIPEFNYIEFRRLRLLADGVGYGVYDFRIQIDVEPEGGDGVETPVTDIKDAYFTLNEMPYVFRRWRIGNFFVPFGLEQVTNDTNNLFLERSIPTQGIFCGDREVGMALYGASRDLNTTWTMGFFADSISESLKERIDDNQGQRISGRLTHLPYYDEPSNGRYLIHTGVGILHTLDQDDRVRFRARPQIHEGPFLIDTGQMPGSNYTSGNVELAAVCGPLAVQSEWFLTNVDLDVGGNTLCWGGYIHGSYFLTGENRIYERFGQHGAQFTRSKPYSNFFLTPGGCGPGGWELKARWSNLSLYEFGAGQYNDFTFGFNWYWSDRVRVMFDWIHPFTTSETVYGKTQSDIIGIRFDYNF